MPTPIIRPLSPNERVPAAPILSLYGEERSYFVVVEAGEHNGRRLAKGDVVVVGGRARPGDTVVLLARGRGRPRLGSVGIAGLRGEAGEPCSAARWAPAGRLLEVMHRAPEPVLVAYGQLALWGASEAA